MKEKLKGGDLSESNYTLGVTQQNNILLMYLLHCADSIHDAKSSRGTKGAVNDSVLNLMKKQFKYIYDKFPDPNNIKNILFIDALKRKIDSDVDFLGINEGYTFENNLRRGIHNFLSVYATHMLTWVPDSLPMSNIKQFNKDNIPCIKTGLCFVQDSALLTAELTNCFYMNSKLTDHIEKIAIHTEIIIPALQVPVPQELEELEDSDDEKDQEEQEEANQAPDLPNIGSSNNEEHIYTTQVLDVLKKCFGDPHEHGLFDGNRIYIIYLPYHEFDSNGIPVVPLECHVDVTTGKPNITFNGSLELNVKPMSFASSANDMKGELEKHVNGATGYSFSDMFGSCNERLSELGLEAPYHKKIHDELKQAFISKRINITDGSIFGFEYPPINGKRKTVGFYKQKILEMLIESQFIFIQAQAQAQAQAHAHAQAQAQAQAQAHAHAHAQAQAQAQAQAHAHAQAQAQAQAQEQAQTFLVFYSIAVYSYVIIDTLKSSGKNDLILKVRELAQKVYNIIENIIILNDNNIQDRNNTYQTMARQILTQMPHVISQIPEPIDDYLIYILSNLEPIIQSIGIFKDYMITPDSPIKYFFNRYTKEDFFYSSTPCPTCSNLASPLPCKTFAIIQAKKLIGDLGYAYDLMNTPNEEGCIALATNDINLKNMTCIYALDLIQTKYTGDVPFKGIIPNVKFNELGKRVRGYYKHCGLNIPPFGDQLECIKQTYLNYVDDLESQTNTIIALASMLNNPNESFIIPVKFKIIDFPVHPYNEYLYNDNLNNFIFREDLNNQHAFCILIRICNDYKNDIMSSSFSRGYQGLDLINYVKTKFMTYYIGKIGVNHVLDLCSDLFTISDIYNFSEEGIIIDEYKRHKCEECIEIFKIFALIHNQDILIKPIDRKELIIYLEKNGWSEDGNRIRSNKYFKTLNIFTLFRLINIFYSENREYVAYIAATESDPHASPRPKPFWLIIFQKLDLHLKKLFEISFKEYEAMNSQRESIFTQNKEIIAQRAIQKEQEEEAEIAKEEAFFAGAAGAATGPLPDITMYNQGIVNHGHGALGFVHRLYD